MTVKLVGSSSGSVSLQAPASTTGGAHRLITLPDRNQIGLGSVLQVKSTTKTDTFSATSTSTAADITGLSVSITPSSTNSKVFVMYSVHVSANSDWGGHVILLLRDSTPIAVATDPGNRSAGTSIVRGNQIYGACVSQHFLDSPASISATTYKLQHKDPSTNNQIYINRTRTDSNDGGYQRLTSSITAMEIAV